MKTVVWKSGDRTDREWNRAKKRNWCDCSLRDGVEAYYETKDVDELNFLEKNMKQYARHEVCKKCMSGIYIHQENGDFSSLDNYISDNEWIINDFLVELAKE